MASGKTEHYQLNQWSLDDPVQMEEFNQDNRAVDAALHQLMSGSLRLAVGSYIGTGGHGEENPTTLTFDFTPRLLLMLGNGWNGHFILTYSSITTYCHPTAGTSSSEIEFRWAENSVSWYHKSSAASQRNAEGREYTYLVIGN